MIQINLVLNLQQVLVELEIQRGKITLPRAMKLICLDRVTMARHTLLSVKLKECPWEASIRIKLAQHQVQVHMLHLILMLREKEERLEPR